jgi:hypothetical protein
VAFVPQDEIIAIALDYLANDKEVQDAVIYLQSEKFHTIITTVESLQEFRDVSTFICMFLNPQSDRQNVCSVSTGG